MGEEFKGALLGQPNRRALNRACHLPSATIEANSLSNKELLAPALLAQSACLMHKLAASSAKRPLQRAPAQSVG